MEQRSSINGSWNDGQEGHHEADDNTIGSASASVRIRHGFPKTNLSPTYSIVPLARRDRPCFCGSTTTENPDAHLKVCNFAHISCPNGCEYQCPRYLMENHKKNCPKEVIPCTHANLGCKDTFKREDQQSHDKSKIFAHMALYCSEAGKMYEEVQQQLQENKNRIAILEKEQYNLKKGQKDQQSKALHFIMEDFSGERDKGTMWTSHTWTTRGYKFCIGVHVNGCSELLGKAMVVQLLAVKQENVTDSGKPILAHFTLRLINFKKGEDKVVTECVPLENPLQDYQPVTYFKADPLSPYPNAFIELSKIPSFIKNNNLHFEILVITDDQ